MDNKKALELILKSIDSLPYGSINLTIHRHSGSTTGIVFNEYENQIFKDNVEFIDFLIKGLREIAEKRQSGEIILRVLVTDGKFKKMTEERRLVKHI